MVNVFNRIASAEGVSQVTCEKCEKPAEPHDWRGWRKTLCQAHRTVREQS